MRTRFPPREVRHAGSRPCRDPNAARRVQLTLHEALRLYGFAGLRDVTSGRREVKRLVGESSVPVLVLDDGQVVRHSNAIVAWARDNPIGSGRS